MRGRSRTPHPSGPICRSAGAGGRAAANWATTPGSRCRHPRRDGTGICLLLIAHSPGVLLVMGEPKLRLAGGTLHSIVWMVSIGALYAVAFAFRTAGAFRG